MTESINYDVIPCQKIHMLHQFLYDHGIFVKNFVELKYEFLMLTKRARYNNFLSNGPLNISLWFQHPTSGDQKRGSKN